jgi:hypothetical protein
MCRFNGASLALPMLSLMTLCCCEELELYFSHASGQI